MTALRPTSRSRTALVATATGGLLAALLVPTGAGAAVTSVDPAIVENDVAAQRLVITTDAAERTDYRFGGRAVFALGSTPSASFTATIQPSASERNPAVTVNLVDSGNGLGVDGPVEAGVYDVTTTANGATLPVTGVPSAGGAGTDRGTSKLRVDPSAKLALASLAPRSLRAGTAATDVTLTGTGFERSTKVEFLRAGVVDSAITVTAPRNLPATPDTDESAEGITTPTSLRRGVAVAATAATGARDVRVTNLSGAVALCTACFSVDGLPLTSANPPAADNDPTAAPVTITFTGSGLVAGGVPVLVYDAAATTTPSPRDSLSVVGRAVRDQTATSVTADFDLRGAAPSSLYRPTVRNPDGSSNVCECTFQVRQTRATVVSSLDSDTATAGLQSTQPQGSTRTFVLNGSGFSRGMRVTVSGEGVTAGPVELLSDTQARTALTTTASAAATARNVTVTRTDGTSSAACSGCYTVTATSSASPTPTPTGGSTATPTVRVDPSTITSQQTAEVTGTAEPGATVEIYAYSRPSTDYVRVRTLTATSDGRFSTTVKPSGNTRLYARAITSRGSADSLSTVLSVRTSINLKVARTGTRTYRFSGSTLPKRAGQLVTVFYETGSGRTIAARARVASDGTYQVVRQFGGTGTFTFVTGTGKDLNNEVGTSNRVRTAVR